MPIALGEQQVDRWGYLAEGFLSGRWGWRGESQLLNDKHYGPGAGANRSFFLTID